MSATCINLKERFGQWFSGSNAGSGKGSAIDARVKVKPEVWNYYQRW
jgi:hypothetical protein